MNDEIWRECVGRCPDGRVGLDYAKLYRLIKERYPDGTLTDRPNTQDNFEILDSLKPLECWGR